MTPASADLDWRAMMEGASDAMFVTDAELAVAWANHAGRELLERTQEELDGKKLDELFARDVLEPLDRSKLAAGTTAGGTHVVQRGDGSRVVVDVRGRLVAPGRVLVVVRDVTAAHAARARIERSEASFRALIESSPDGVVVHAQGKTRYLNQAMARLVGWDDPAEVIGTSVLEFVHPDDRKRVTERIRSLSEGSDRVPFTEERLLCKDGTSFVASIAGLSIQFDGEPMVVAIVRDITERRQLDRQMHQAERMASLGALSAGVAHEINNPLTYVILRLDILSSLATRARRLVDSMARAPAGSADLAQAELAGLVDDLAGHLATAKEGAHRVRSIVQDLRVFAQADREVPLPVDIHGPIELAAGIALHQLKQRATIVRDFTTDAFVMGSEGKLAQAFLHLFLHAAQAIPPGAPERHEVRVATRVEAERVIITFEDTGVGIPLEHLPHVFEPFFTSKPHGVGAGLGLSMCHGIVTSLGGTITVEPRSPTDSIGTRFTISLPVAQPISARSLPPPSLPSTAWSPPDPAEGRVLLFHPSASVRRALEQLLLPYGEVVAVETAETAMQLVHHGATFDLILTAEIAPGSSERSVRQAIEAEHPELVGRIVELPAALGEDGAELDVEMLRPWLERLFPSDGPK